MDSGRPLLSIFTEWLYQDDNAPVYIVFNYKTKNNIRKMMCLPNHRIITLLKTAGYCWKKTHCENAQAE